MLGPAAEREQRLSKKKQAKTLPKTLPGTVHAQMIRCGRPNCRCAGGQLHGPYYYQFWREGGRLRKAYVSRDALLDARQACTDRQQRERTARRERAASQEQARQMRAALRDIDAMLKELGGW
jgi:hypothetical protein